MAERQATEDLPSIRIPLLASEERLAESTRETGTQLKHGSKDGSSRFRRAFTEAADQNQFGSDTPSRLHPRGLKWRGRYYAQDESGTFIAPPERLPEHSSIGAQYVRYSRDSRRTKFEEAALYINEGDHNEKFTSHPNGRYSKLAYNIVHLPAFYLVDFLATVLLMGLAIFEDPPMINFQPQYKAYVVVTHAVLEFFLLTIIGSNILLRFIWMKPRTFLKQRTVLAAFILLLMYVEATVVITNQKSHFRVLRALRVIFFIDTYIMVGVRRVLRQILQCLKPIVDVMILVFFMVAIFALMAYYLFAEVNPTFFGTYINSFVSMFITLTTANHPSVFMEAYFQNRLAPIFFMIYLFLTLYFFSNVLLAVVYANFSDKEKRKFKKLYLHKREALRLAFDVLEKDGYINFKDFLLLMEEYRPRVPEYQVLCIFKALQKRQDARQQDTTHRDQHCLSIEEFYNFYELQNMRWKRYQDGHVVRWFERFPASVHKWFERLHKIIHFHFFNSIVAIVVYINAFYLIGFTLLISYHCGPNGVDRYNDTLFDVNLTKYCGPNRFASSPYLVGSFIFNIIYMIEIAMRILAVGPAEYFGKWWNRIDFFVIFASFVCLCVEADADNHHILKYLIVVRPIKLFRLLRLKHRYYNIMNTMFFLGHRMLSVLLLLVVIYYFFAIIGMEVFSSKVYAGCCTSALFDVSGAYSANATTVSPNIYWLNNFDDIYQSYVILYEEMVVNNWYVQMEGFVSETSIFARFYFISFWICMTIVVSVVIAYIVDAFVFKIQFVSVRKHCQIHGEIYDCNCHETNKKVVEVEFKGEEINMLLEEITRYDNRKRKRMSFSDTVRRMNRIDFDILPNRIVFSGRRLRTKEDLSLQMYKSELEGWVNEREQERPVGITGPAKVQKRVREKIVDKLKAFAFFILE